MIIDIKICQATCGSDETVPQRPPGKKVEANKRKKEKSAARALDHVLHLDFRGAFDFFLALVVADEEFAPHVLGLWHLVGVDNGTATN